MGMSRIIDCFFGSQFDPGSDEWVAIQVYRDGNVIELARFPTEDEADECADNERKEQEAHHGQFGVGA
jgi:hypothetical protein